MKDLSIKTRLICLLAFTSVMLATEGWLGLSGAQSGWARMEIIFTALAMLSAFIVGAITIRSVAGAATRISGSERRYRTLFESSHDALLIMSGATVIDCNKKALELFGVKPMELDDLLEAIEAVIDEHRAKTLEVPRQPLASGELSIVCSMRHWGRSLIKSCASWNNGMRHCWPDSSCEKGQSGGRVDSGLLQFSGFAIKPKGTCRFSLSSNRGDTCHADESYTSQ